MSEKVIVKNSSGIGSFGLLGVAFVVLKLCGVIDWSWWYVTMPFWIGFAIVGVGFAISGLIILAVSVIEAIAKSKRQSKK